MEPIRPHIATYGEGASWLQRDVRPAALGRVGETHYARRQYRKRDNNRAKAVAQLGDGLGLQIDMPTNALPGQIFLDNNLLSQLRHHTALV